ncbi:MAG: hypothetical protein RH917_15370 [Lacipirellulaceae bacterium]
MPDTSARSVLRATLVLTMMFLFVCLLVSRSDAEESPNEAAEGSEDVQAASREPMDNGRLGKLLEAHFKDSKIEGQPGLWRIDLSKLEKQPPAKEEKQQGPAPEDEETDSPEAESPETQSPEAESPEQVAPGADNHLPPVVLVMTDQRADRMRIMMPIRNFDPQTVEDLQLALIALHANYDRALDARYAIQDGVLWSVFIHPLGSLTPKDLTNALNQVQALRENTGTTYSSSELIFGPGQEAPEDEDIQDRLT